MTFVYKFAEKISVVAEDARYNVLFENILERRNTRYDNPMVDIGVNYLVPLRKQRITIIPTSRPNYFEDYKPLECELDNSLAFEFVEMLKNEPHMNMWFAKDNLSYASKYGELI